MSKVKINYDNIPDEMKALDQFVCFDIEVKEDGKETKVPYTPGTNKKARSNEASTWRSFDEAMEDVDSGARQYVGFCLSDDDPYVFFDLDETDDPEEIEDLKEVYGIFPSFSERSVSGKGVHIIAKGKLQGRGLHNKYFGLFDKFRFILLTGHILSKRKHILTANKKMLLKLQDDICASSHEGFNFPLEEKEWDMPYWSLYKFCHDKYKDKFYYLMGGAWKRYESYPSQSEADHALISIMCEFTESNELVRYLFAKSGLFREWKGGGKPHTYIDRTIQRHRAKEHAEKERREKMKQIAQENLAAERERTAKAKAKVKTKPKKKAAPKKKAIKKTGLDVYPTDIIDSLPKSCKVLKELSRWIYFNTKGPNQKMAIFGAMSFATWIAQRAYLTNTRTGCNNSFWLVADTGWGKEGFMNAIKNIGSELIKDKPALLQTHVGKMASGQAIETVISEYPRVISRVAEAGAFWRGINSPNRPGHIDVLVEQMLSLYMATNEGNFHPTRRKAKRDEDVKSNIFRPAISFYGESTAADLFSDFTQDAIHSGLIQRQIFLCIEEAEYVPLNKHSYPMKPWLREALIEFISAAESLDLQDETIVVEMTEEADERITEYTEKWRRYGFNKNKDSLKANYMNRSGLKALRLSAALSPLENPHEPCTSFDLIDWTVKFVDSCDKKMLAKFQSGEVGKGQSKQEMEILKEVRRIANMPKEEREKTYKFPTLAAEDPTIITRCVLRSRVIHKSCFTNDRLGRASAFERIMHCLAKADILVPLDPSEADKEYKTFAKLLRYNATT